jgi:carboxypeptidase PM20D1
MPARFEGVSERMFDYLAPEMPFGQRAIFANLWLFRPVVRRMFEASPGTNAMVRTTTAATMVSGSPKENVLPIRARAVVNFRVLPGDSTADVLAHVRRVVADTMIRVRLLGAPSEPSPVTDPSGPGVALVAGAARRVFPDAVIAPYLMVGGTDTRHYESLTGEILRFLPVVARDSDVARLHGTDERLSLAGYASAVRFYAQLMVGAASP